MTHLQRNISSTFNCTRICWKRGIRDIWTDHGSPVSDIIQDFVLQRVQGHAGLQNELCVQAHCVHHSQQQEQLLITVGPWTEGHTVGQVLQSKEQLNDAISSCMHLPEMAGHN